MQRWSFAVVLALSTLSVHAQTLVVSTLAGTTDGGGYNDGSGAGARFSQVRQLAFDGAGNLLIADSGNHVIRRMTPDGQVTTIAGRFGVSGSSDGPALGARFSFPAGVAYDRTSGAIYVSDTGNQTIRRIAPDGTVTTFAGAAGVSGSANGSGSVARFNNPQQITVDPSGNVFVADANNYVIRKITPAGQVSLFAGTVGQLAGAPDGFGTQAHISHPTGLTSDSDGNLYVTERSDSSIRKITPDARVTTIAGVRGGTGLDNGPGNEARFNHPQGVGVDASGNVYIADTDNHAIRKITPAQVVSTFAGSTSGFFGNRDATGTNARFFHPSAIAVDASGNLWVADRDNFTIRKITPSADVTTVAGAAPQFGNVLAQGTAARFTFPDAVGMDASGNVWLIDETQQLKKIAPDGRVTSVAGASNTTGASDGTGNQARFNYAYGLAVGVDGNIYVADTFNHTIRKVTPAGVVTTIAGQAGVRGKTNGVGTAATFNYPYSIATDSRGNLYVADTYNSVIRMIDPAGVVTTFAGGGLAGTDGVGTQAGFYFPTGIATDAARNIYVGDGNYTIRKVTQGGQVTTIAGKSFNSGFADGIGSGARFGANLFIAADPDGVLWVSDSDNHILRRVANANVTTAAGAPGGAGNVNGSGAAARFFTPWQLAVDPNDRNRLVIADSENQAVRIATVAAPTIVRFTAEPSVVKAGDPVTLTWETADATSVTIDNGFGSVATSGLFRITITATTTYTLTATGPGGTVTAQTTVAIAGSRRHAAAH